MRFLKVQVFATILTPIGKLRAYERFIANDGKGVCFVEVFCEVIIDPSGIDPFS